MEKLKVFVICSENETRFRMKSALESPDIAVVGYGDLTTASVQKAAGLSPDVALIVYEAESAIDIGAKIYQSVPMCAVVLASETVTLELIDRAERAGIALTVELDTTGARVAETVRRAGTLISTRARFGEEKLVSDSRVISVFTPKGGTGKTTIAVNIAISLSLERKKVAMIDLSVDNAQLALFLDLQAKDTVAELSQERGNLTMDALRSYMVQHYTGASLLAGPATPEDGEFVQPRTVEAAIAVMRPFFDCIVIDLPSNFSELTLTAIENSDRIIVPLISDIASVKAAHTAMTVFGSLRQSEKAVYVYNRSAKAAFLTEKDVKKALGREVDFILPEDKAVADKCQCIGRPIVVEAPRSQLAQKLRKLSSSLAGITDERSRGATPAKAKPQGVKGKAKGK